MSILYLEFDVDESAHSAVLWYEARTAGRGREEGQTILKPRFVFCRVTPGDGGSISMINDADEKPKPTTPSNTPLVTMGRYYYKGDDLINIVKINLDENACRAVLYSKDGFEMRTRIKQDIEAKIERRSLWLCCSTCGLVLCCFCSCCPCRKWETKNANRTLNDEEYYCRRIDEEQQYPQQNAASTAASDIQYEFIAAASSGKGETSNKQ